MTKCKQAIENPTPCGKDICCFECEDKDVCEDVCSSVSSEECPDAVLEENQMTIFKSAVSGITQVISNIAKEKKRLDEEDKKMREELEHAMESYGVKSFENEFIKMTYVEPTTKVTVDSKKLKADFPDIYSKCSKVSDVKASVRIAVK